MNFLTDLNGHTFTTDVTEDGNTLSTSWANGTSGGPVVTARDSGETDDHFIARHFKAVRDEISG